MLDGSVLEDIGTGQANSFLSKVDDRKEANMRIAALEDMLRSKTAEHQGNVDENMKAQHNRLMMVQEKQRLQSRCLDLKQRHPAVFQDMFFFLTGDILCTSICMQFTLL